MVQHYNDPRGYGDEKVTGAEVLDTLKGWVGFFLMNVCQFFYAFYAPAD